MTLEPGSRLGPHEILTLLGRGGMGEVYQARDLKLNRDVAIKVLPEHLATDPERLARLRREAQVLAALNHTHIAHIHGLEDANGVPALVLELVQGSTLSERIASGPIPFSEAIGVAGQIADGLEAAHEKGIIPVEITTPYLIRAVNRPSRDLAEAMAFSWVDTKEVRPDASKFYAFLNDENRPPYHIDRRRLTKLRHRACALEPSRRSETRVGA